MPRKPNPERRTELEEAAVDYVLSHGVSDLSLRPLADALGVSTYSLVYHFGSKEELVAAVIAAIEERERVMAAGWMKEPGGMTPGAIMRRYWDEWCLPDQLAPYHRLFYEIYALSLQHPERFPGFMERGANPWLPFIRELAQTSGVSEKYADVIAALMASTVLGALLVLLGTGEKGAASQAVYAAAEYVDELVASHGDVTYPLRRVNKSRQSSR